MQNRPRLAVVGDVGMDYTVELPAHSADEKVIPDRSSRELGGTGANVAAVAQALGTPTSLFATVGTDPIGTWTLDALQHSGIDTTHVGVHTGDTAIATILRRGSQREVVVDIGVGLDVDLDLAHLATCDMIYVSYSPATVPTLTAAGLGPRTVVGFEAWMLDRPDFAEALDACRLGITNEAGWAALSSRGQFPTVDIVRTLGARGGAVRHRSGHDEPVPPYKVEPIDETGAGDCFAGTLCHYLLHGLDLVRAATAASVAAALSTTGRGAQGRLPEPDEVELIIKNSAAAKGVLY